MPRIRTIKPEFCTSEQIAECSTNSRLLFVLMWCFCDDAGRHPANCKRIKMECFPGDAFTDKQISGFVAELLRVGLLSEYTHENAAYWQVTGWFKHQRIDRPSYKYGPFDEDGNPSFDEYSTSVRRAFDDHSPPEGNGMEGIGKEGKGVDVCGVGERSPTPPAKCDELTPFSFVVSDGSEWSLPQSKLDQYRKTFPELELEREFGKAALWLTDNPKRRKTRSGMPSFLSSWLGRAQNSGAAGMSRSFSAVGKKTAAEKYKERFGDK